MNKELQRKFSKLEVSRLALIEKIKSISHLELETSLFPGKWSVSQIFYHLNKAERFSTIYVSKKRLAVNDLKVTGFKEQFKMILLKILFKLPFGLKAPVNVLGDVPDNVDYTGITAEWDETRSKLGVLLDSLEDEILHKNVFKQPAIGRVNIFQMLDFMQAHFDRHQKQVENIIAKRHS